MRMRLPGPRSPGWVLAESVAAAAFSLLSMLAIDRVIGPHAAGVGTIAVAAFLIVEVFGAVLFPDALVQLPRPARRHSDSAVMAAVLLGPAWAGTAGATRVVALSAMALVLHGNHSSLFVAVGKARRSLQIAVAFLTVPLVALAVVRPATPLEAAFVWSAQCLFVPPVLAWVVLRELKRPVRWLARKVAPAAAAAATATAIMALVVLLLHGATAAPPLLRLATAACGGVLFYAAAAWLALGRRLPRALLTSAPAPPTPPGDAALRASPTIDAASRP